MRFALVFLAACGFPDVRPSEGGVADSTIQDAPATDSGSDAMDSAVVVTGCQKNTDCVLICKGKIQTGCACQVYLDGGPVPMDCDNTCALTGCSNKMPACVDGGCQIQ